MYLQKVKKQKKLENNFYWRLEGSKTKIARSKSIIQRHGSADPDPYQNVTDPATLVPRDIG
jgi:hypothetical protein